MWSSMSLFLHHFCYLFSLFLIFGFLDDINFYFLASLTSHNLNLFQNLWLLYGTTDTAFVVLLPSMRAFGAYGWRCGCVVVPLLDELPPSLNLHYCLLGGFLLSPHTRNRTLIIENDNYMYLT